jgi:hypothetical protein
MTNPLMFFLDRSLSHEEWLARLSLYGSASGSPKAASHSEQAHEVCRSLQRMSSDGQQPDPLQS